MGTSFTEGTSCSTLNSSIPDVERFSQAMHQKSLMIRTDRSHFTSKPAHISRHLPPSTFIIGKLTEGLTVFALKGGNLI
jgi:hypothetical protein